MAHKEEEHQKCPHCGLSIADFQELSKQVEELKRELNEVKKRLSFYENSNTPPSKNSLIYREMKQKRKEEWINNNDSGNGSSSSSAPPKKPGRKDGHAGVTQVFAPTGNPIIHTMGRCPNCKSTRLSVTSTQKRLIVDVPEPLPYSAREHIINVYECSRCGANELIPESVARDLPSSVLIEKNKKKKGNAIVTLGRNTLATISLLWSVARLPQRKISYVIETLYQLKLSPATVGHALEHVSEKLESLHERVRKKINRSRRANFDETGMPVDGKKGWIWIAATKKFAFVQVAMSRGSDVLQTYFPKFKGVAIVDGWRSYRYFPVLQRCWAHPLREAEILALRCNGRGKEEAEYLLSSLRGLFHETKEELKEHPPPNRKLHERQLRKLRYIQSKKYLDLDAVKFVSKLKSASKDLFTFTLYRGVDPTNSHAERQLREPIVHRKIRGQLKSEKGTIMFSRLMTAVSTWKLQRRNPFLEFKKCL
ncbi:MAG: IS66 family transposase [Nitrososphaerota archaeon]|nr:IS66 family transposase [Nitrososphaerota archaeon]